MLWVKVQLLHWGFINKETGENDETGEDDKADDNLVSLRLPRTCVSLRLQRYFVQPKATVNWGQP